MPTQSITVKLGLDGLATVTSGLRSISASATAAVGSLTRIAAPVATLVASAAGLAAVANGFRGIVAQGGKLNDLNLQTSVSVRNLIRWRQVFEEAGKSADSIGTTFDRTAKAIYEVATTGGAGEVALNRLGLSAENLLSVAPDEQFQTLATAINGIANPTERSAIAMKIFGKSAGELLPVFDAMQDLTKTDGALGRLPEVLGRNVKILDNIGDGFTQLKLKSQQVFAGIIDQVGPSLQSAVDAATQIDLTGVGQSIGAFINLAKEAWTQGRFGEFISLSIEAGFEIGGNAARRTFREIGEFVGTTRFWDSVGLALLTSINEGMKLAVGGVVRLGEFMADTFYESVKPFEFVFTAVFNVIGQKFEELINSMIRKANLLLPIPILPGVTFRPLDGDITSGIQGQIGKNAGVAREVIDNFFDNSTSSFKSLIGFDGATGETFDATNRLAELIEKMKADREKVASTEGTITGQLAAQVPTLNVMAGIRAREAESLRVLRDLEEQRAITQGSFALTEAEKYRTNLELLKAQRVELERMVALLREQAAAPGLTDSDRTQIGSRADSFDSKLSGVDRELGGIGADPNSTPQQMLAAMTDLQDQFGTVSQGIASGFKNVIGTAVDSVSRGLQKLIGDTEYWSARLGNVAGPIMGALTESISRMFTEWIVQRGLAAAKNMFFSAQEGATDAAAKAPGALMTSISSFGIAAGIGLAAFLAATALTGGFREGGYTGNGGVNDVAGVVHGREYVMDAATVQRVGLPQLQAIQEGAASPAAAGGSGGSSVNIASFDSRMDARRWADSQDGETWFVDMARKTSHRWKG